MALEDFIGALFGSNIYNTAPPTGSIVYDYFLPFVIIWVVFYGVLSAINIFRRNNINLILSVALTLMMTATPYWFAIGQFIAEWGAWSSVILFVVVFSLGIAGWAWHRGEEYSKGTPIESTINRSALDSLLSEIRRLEQKRDLYEMGTPQWNALNDQIKVRKTRARKLAESIGLSEHVID